MKTNFKYFTGCLTISLGILFFVIFLLPMHADALVENNEELPNSVLFGFFVNPGCWNQQGNRDERHGQFGWLSRAGESSSETITVDQGVNSVDLWLNSATVQCNSNVDFNTGAVIDKTLAATNTRTIWHTTSYGVANFSTTNSIMNYNCTNTWNLRWVKICNQGFFDRYPTHQDVTLSGLGGLPVGTHNITITAHQRLIHWYVINGQNVFRCVGQVNGQIVPANGIDDPNCGAVPVSKTITIVVRPAPNPTYYDLTPEDPVITNSGEVNFTVNNNGDGISRQTGGSGARIDTRIWKNSHEVYYSVTDTPNGTAYDKLIDPGAPWTNTVLIPGGVDVGDTICAEIGVHPSAGITDGAITNNDWRSVGGATPYCVTITAKPYFRVYGSDVVVGKNFVDSSGVCPAGKNPNASINTFSMDRPGIGWVGSGSQFAASATGTITGFMTASMHNNVVNPPAPTDLGVPRPWLGLAFGNNSPPTAGGNDTTGYTGCMPDYEAYVNANASNLFTQPSSATPIVINQTLVNNSNKHVFINGDATITSNITDSATTYNSLDDMNPIIVIVKGNINIAPGVDTLDGLYVAIPKGDGSGGTINTCAVNPITDACINTLTVNGAFAAKKVELNRLAGDVNSVTDPNQADSSTNIAEKFIFTPDLFLGLMNRNNINNSTTNQDISTVGGYESLVGLPPVL